MKMKAELEKMIIQRERMAMFKEMQRCIGFPFEYGSNGISGYENNEFTRRDWIGSFDCSGFALHILRYGGFSLQDMTAKTLRSKFRGCEIQRKDAMPGDLYFYGKKSISHVCVCYCVWNKRKNYRLLIGANSGTSRTKSIDDAWKRNAMVKITRDNYRLRDLACIINPFLKFQ